MSTEGRFPPEPTTAAIVLSRQPLRPCGLTPWVTKVVEAATWIRQQNLTLLSSLGMQTWEMITAVGSRLNLRMKIYPDSSSACPEFARKIISDFALTAETSLVPLPGVDADTDEERHLRDQVILSEADLLIPISIRSDGYMSRALAEQEQAGKKIVRQFDIGPPPRSSRLAYNLSQIRFNPGLDQMERNYLVHWTRATNSPWPDERPIDFYQSILESVRYPRTAFDTLCHILETRVLRASSRHMPENTPTVSFTGLTAQEVLPLMRWRARYTQMSFEPYGLAIPIDLAKASGICAVEYRDKKSGSESAVPAWLTQSIGLKSDWRQEKEYRHLGDLSLDLGDFATLVAFCLSPSEASTIAGRYGIRALPLSSG